MTTRSEGIREIEREMGLSSVALLNFIRFLTHSDVPAPFNLALGRGYRNARLMAEWLVSLLLAIALDNPTNAAWQVPACGNLRVVKSRIVREYSKTIAEAGNWHTSLKEEAFDVPEFLAHRFIEWEGQSLLVSIVDMAKHLAEHWGDEVHERFRAGFSLTINLGTSMSAEMMQCLAPDEDGMTLWCRTLFLAQDSETKVSTANPVRRQAVINLQHIEMLARLYAGTLAHEKPSSSHTPALPGAGADEITSDTAKAAPVARPGGPVDAPTPNTRKKRTLNKAQSASSFPTLIVRKGERVRRVGSSAFNLENRHHGLEPHHHASA